MGCGSSAAKVAAQVADAPVKSTGTLLEPSFQKPWVPSDTESFPIFMDSLAGCLEVDGEMLKISDVTGGPLGLWNNRPRTDKVQKGDFVIKVRKAGAAQWIARDTKQMLAAFDAEGPFEIEIKRATPATAPVAAPEEAPAPAPAPVAAPVQVPAPTPATSTVEASAATPAGAAAEASAATAAPSEAPAPVAVAAPSQTPEAPVAVAVAVEAPAAAEAPSEAVALVAPAAA